MTEHGKIMYLTPNRTLVRAEDYIATLETALEEARNDLKDAIETGARSAFEFDQDVNGDSYGPEAPSWVEFMMVEWRKHKTINNL